MLQQWFSEHPLISYSLLLGFTVYIFNNVFRPGRLPILKEIFVYLMMALGCLVLLILQLDKLPLIQCMGIAVAMMLMLRLRQLYDKWRSHARAAGEVDEQGRSKRSGKEAGAADSESAGQP